MASSNPFRKRTDPTATAPAFPAPAPARFPPLDAIETSYVDPDSSGTDQKSKVVKKVRVLSPPPLSPDSPQWSLATPSIASGLERRGENDSFDATSTGDSDREVGYTAAPPPPQDGSRIPANPFSKTLRDMETVGSGQKLEQERRAEGDTLKAANTARASLDVSSFKRLLMTGNMEADSSAKRKSMPGALRDSTNVSSTSFFLSTDDSSRDKPEVSSESRDVSFISRDASDTPDDELYHENISDSSASLPMVRGKKPPPPPSSRHGKSISISLGASDRSIDILGPKPPSDVNRPLPPTPLAKSFGIDAESALNLESVGKKADMLPTPQTTPDSGKKSGPAPPPRRGHSRGESKINIVPKESYSGTRNFDDETPSRSSSIRSGIDRPRHDPHAPVPPPPPRRSNAGSRQSLIMTPDTAAAVGAAINDSPVPYGLHAEPDKSYALPTLSSVDPNLSRNSQTGNYRVSAPPPPPARNASVRRPASLKSVDSNSRRASAETKPHSGIAPPPPPRRQRGSSRGSIDGPYRRTSLDGVPRTEQRQIEEGNHAGLDSASAYPGPMSPQSAIDQGKGVDILADLNALQREVDALRGKLGP